jgi:hypothetical protein
VKDNFRVSDITRILKVSETFVTDAINRGELKAVKVGHYWKITFKDATYYINAVMQRRKR